MNHILSSMIHNSCFIIHLLDLNIGTAPKIHKTYINTTTRGFTIVELLVVTAIIALLAATIFVQIQTVRERARDAERESEIKSLQTALAIHAINTRIYPAYTDLVVDGTDQLSQDLRAGEALQGAARDPLNVGNYRYLYNPTDGGVYTYNGSNYRIRYYLETNSIVGKAAGEQNVGP